MFFGRLAARKNGVCRLPGAIGGLDRGKDVKTAPWYHLGPVYNGNKGERINDHHLTLEEKKKAREVPE